MEVKPPRRSVRPSPWHLLLVAALILGQLRWSRRNSGLPPATLRSSLPVVSSKQQAKICRRTARCRATAVSVAPTTRRRLLELPGHSPWVRCPMSSDRPAYVAGAGHRLVAFTLSVTQPPADSGQLNASTEVTRRPRGRRQAAADLPRHDRRSDRRWNARFGRGHRHGQLRGFGPGQ